MPRPPARRGTGVTLRAGDDAKVDGDALLLQRAVGKLLDNAIDFSPEGGQIEVSLDVHPRRVEVSVRDHGPGIRLR